MSRVRSALVPRAAALALVALVAALHAGAFALYLWPELQAGIPHDMIEYRELGQSLLTGHYARSDGGAPQPIFYPSPGYPVFYAALYAVFGNGLIPVAIGQAVIYAAVCLLVYWLGRDLWNERVGMLAAILTATFPPLAYYAGLHLTELLTTLCLVLYVALLRITVRSPSWWRWALVGAVMGYAALVRPIFQILIPVTLLAALALRSRGQVLPLKQRASWLVTSLATTLLVLAPWLYHNYVNFGEAAVTLEPTGTLMFTATWSRAFDNQTMAALQDLVRNQPALSDEELRTRLSRISTDPARVEDMHRYVRQWQTYLSNPSDTDRGGREALVVARSVSARQLSMALDNIQRDPLRYVRTRTMDWGLAWFSTTPVRTDDAAVFPTAPRLTLWAYQALMVVLAVVGAVVAWRSNRSALILALPIVVLQAAYLPFPPDARFTIPAQPFVLLLAAAGGVWLWSVVRQSSTVPREALSPTGSDAQQVLGSVRR